MQEIGQLIRKGSRSSNRLVLISPNPFALLLMFVHVSRMTLRVRIAKSIPAGQVLMSLAVSGATFVLAYYTADDGGGVVNQTLTLEETRSSGHFEFGSRVGFSSLSCHLFPRQPKNIMAFEQRTFMWMGLQRGGIRSQNCSTAEN